MNTLSGRSIARPAEWAGCLAGTLAVGALVALDGRLPSPFTSLFFVPIALLAYRHPLGLALVATILASVFSSPAMVLAGVQVDGSILPVLWLGWPAVYLFLTVSLSQWSGIRQARQQLDSTEQRLTEVGARNDRREQELETLSSIHATVLSGSYETAVIEEISRRVGEVTGAAICDILVPAGGNPQGALIPAGAIDEAVRKALPNGVPFGEGVAGWAVLHRRVAASRNVFEDPRYDGLREFAREAGIVSAAAAPIEIDQDLLGALVICYREEREFTPEDLTRLERLARQTELAIRSVRQRGTLARFAFDTALALTEAIESRDPYTGGHCRRLAEHATMTAGRLALPNREIELIRLGAALHDMGKIVVPDSILKKPGRLTPEEYAIVKQHCYSGGQICKRVGFLMEAYPIVYHHHERWDGAGYPDGLKGERIPIGARIVAVVDAFDAITTDRPYREALAHQEAVAILKDGAGSQWDPAAVRVFLEALEAGAPRSAQHAPHQNHGSLLLPTSVEGGEKLP